MAEPPILDEAYFQKLQSERQFKSQLAQITYQHELARQMLLGSSLAQSLGGVPASSEERDKEAYVRGEIDVSELERRIEKRLGA